ncbi:MAG: RNA polymerase sigma factor [Clostridia bacterium]|nr:RNA polymerase sigma factor [Clostridia bacterium]
MNRTVNYKEQTDETLVALTLMRDEAAFEELVIRHRKAALLMAKTVTRNIHTAEDAVQDAFLCAWQRLDTLKDTAKFGHWVCRIAKYRAINLAKRYKDYIPFDEVETYLADQAEDITGYYDDKLETELLRSCVEKLSEKIGTVIRLHYFEGLSVSDIAIKMNLAEGTVKSRLSAGRDQIRKELGYVDKNNKHETLVEAVMRRVEEFKEWRLKNSKMGFEEDYKDVLSQVESLPDSEKKFYAMADVLKLGYWYLSDGKTDEMRAKLKEAAIKGNNKEVLALCIGFGKDKYSGKEKVEYVYNTVIPELLKYDIPGEVAYHHYWLGYDYFQAKDYDNARKEFALALETGAENPLYIALTKSTLEGLDGVGELLSDRSKFLLECTAEELILRGNKLYFSQQPGFDRRYMDVPSYVKWAGSAFWIASRADGLILDETMKAGDSVTDSAGKITLTCVSTDATVSTACGDFHGCVEMHTYNPIRDRYPAPIFVAWYKPNIGLVAFGWKEQDGEVFGKITLREYEVCGGHGWIPLCAGNFWSYTAEELEYEHTFRTTVTATADNKAYLSYRYYVIGTPFDENSWRDNLLYARNNYYSDHVALDVSAYHDRAVALAQTPWEKKVAEVSRNVMNRIFQSDTDANPDAKQEGVWNFLTYCPVTKVGEKITVSSGDRTYEFEWKNTRNGCFATLINFIYDILQNGLGALWDPAWLEYADRDEEFQFHRPARWDQGKEFIGYGRVYSGETVTTTLGTFENCLRIRARTSQNESPGITYQNTDKDYYFAPGIGLVRIITYVTSYEDIRIYDLVSYKGTGEGYMPIEDGMERHYKYLNEKQPNVHGGTSYYYVKDDEGKLVILGDQLGMMDVEKKKEE